MTETDAPEYLTTARLRLAPLAPADVAEVHAIYADPATWLHLPAGRHTTLAQTERVVDESEQSWAASGLGRWAIRLRHDLPGTDLPGTALPAGTLIGVASAMLMDCGARNFGYRLTPASWGIGLATEAATVALAVAQASAYPVTARVLAANPASVRVLERIGLTRVWRGRGAPGTTPADAPALPDTTALERLIFADRPLTPELLAAIIRLG
ncbi:GNAT family N-acetyltransferase [Cryobacterium sp. N22]|uniref:GNAT family N-acetyltransferase n=1 Tax=Cryobacterium sp. N22 TaxID=2048290 RepID=UPI001304FB95|nr:GNAT family N-acetyltransferase [Cryobacterium sp. N22]